MLRKFWASITLLRVVCLFVLNLGSRLFVFKDTTMPALLWASGGTLLGLIIVAVFDHYHPMKAN